MGTKDFKVDSGKDKSNNLRLFLPPTGGTGDGRVFVFLKGNHSHFLNDSPAHGATRAATESVFFWRGL